jgi:hypothetical protein
VICILDDAKLSHSLALWYQRKGSCDSAHLAQVEVHFNLWRLPLGRARPEANFLDIGLKVMNAENIKQIVLFFPFTVSPSQVIDLGDLLRNRKTAVAIFNESLSVNQKQQGRVQIENEQGKAVLCCHCLNMPHDLMIEPASTRDNVQNHDATILRIKDDVIDRFDRVIDNYVRFRIVLAESALGAFYTEYSPPDKRLFSSFEKTEVVDFRLNERRNLPDYIDTLMYSGPNERFSVLQINFFLIREIYSEFLMAYRSFHKGRSLEMGIWKPYIERHLESSGNINQSIIYHWKKIAEGKSGIEDYNAVAKFRRREVSSVTIVLFIAILVGIGAVGSLLANLLSGG